MLGGIEVKVCGLTRVGDAQAAAATGADFLGFIFFPPSPRNLEIHRFEAMRPNLPDLPKVAVTVGPEAAFLDELRGMGFDYFQIHYPVADTSEKQLNAWSEQLSPERLWLAPKLKPGEALDPLLLPLADAWLWDAYRKDAFGGTGQLSDWAGFREMKERFPEKRWTLAGGLGPENVVAAVAETGASRIDLNSGVERSPGIKDSDKMAQVKIALENR